MTVQILINGNHRDVCSGQSLSELVSELGFSAEHVAIEYNGRVLEKDELGEIAIKPEDEIEIVRFVGGG
jgi:sulfur carrier protein